MFVYANLTLDLLDKVAQIDLVTLRRREARNLG